MGASQSHAAARRDRYPIRVAGRRTRRTARDGYHEEILRINVNADTVHGAHSVQQSLEPDGSLQNVFRQIWPHQYYTFAQVSTRSPSSSLD
jgi:hypothetical protein